MRVSESPQTQRGGSDVRTLDDGRLVTCLRVSYSGPRRPFCPLCSRDAAQRLHTLYILRDLVRALTHSDGR